MFKPPFILSELIAKIWYALGVGLGSGLAPKAPGTFGSLAVLVFTPLWFYIGFNATMVVLLALCVAGVVICEHTARLMQVHDDPRIVFDEWVGQSIVLLPLVYLQINHWWAVLLAFVLFRLFDIAKPFPISWADKKVNGGFGIMLDDILAGVIAAIILYIILLLL